MRIFDTYQTPLDFAQGQCDLVSSKHRVSSNHTNDMFFFSNKSMKKFSCTVPYAVTNQSVLWQWKNIEWINIYKSLNLNDLQIFILSAFQASFETYRKILIAPPLIYNSNSQLLPKFLKPAELRILSLLEAHLFIQVQAKSGVRNS